VVLGCANTQPPHDFLRVESEAWRKWLDAIVDVHIEDKPLASIWHDTQPFERTNIVITQVDPTLRITLHADRLTRRQALWRIAQKYGLSITPGYRDGIPSCILITKR
jgi:hypothetical protein